MSTAGWALDELAAWLRLLGTPQIGNVAARRLLAAFGDPQALFDARPTAWTEVVGETAAQALRQPPELLAAQVDTTWRWLGEDAVASRHVLTLGDPA